MASRLLSDLHVELRPLVEKFLAEANMEGIEVLITCTYRSAEEQTYLYSLGRTVPGKKVTNAQAGQSAHNFTINGKPASKAFDVVPMSCGKCLWDNARPEWKRLGEIGERLGLEWAGNWKMFKEYPHFQLKGA